MCYIFVRLQKWKMLLRSKPKHHMSWISFLLYRWMESCTVYSKSAWKCVWFFGFVFFLCFSFLSPFSFSFVEISEFLTQFRKKKNSINFSNSCSESIFRFSISPNNKIFTRAHHVARISFNSRIESKFHKSCFCFWYFLFPIFYCD